MAHYFVTLHSGKFQIYRLNYMRGSYCNYILNYISLVLISYAATLLMNGFVLRSVGSYV